MLIAKTEYWHHFGKRTVDLFGFIDTIALNPTAWSEDTLAIQSTTADHHSHRVVKIIKHPNTLGVIRHWRVEVWSWGKKGARGHKKEWTLRRTGFTARGNRVIAFEAEGDPLY